MLRYLSRRVLDMLVVILGVLTLVFFTMRLSGDPVLLMVTENATPEEIAHLREILGFNRPLLIQYVDFVFHAATGRFGESLHFHKAAVGLVTETAPATVMLAVIALLIALTIAIPAGIISAVKRNSWIDTITMAFALLGQSMPTFWLGLVLIIQFGVTWKWLPTNGYGTLAHLVLPALTLGIYTTARLARLTRSGMLDVLKQDYVRTAKAKGLAQRVILFKHALRNASLPIITMVGLEFGTLLGGAVVTETVFSWPGIGRLVVQAIFTRDYPLVQACVFFIALLFVCINLVVDLAYAWLDPRIHYQ